MSRRPPIRERILISLILPLLLCLGAASAGARTDEGAPENAVYVVPFEGMVDLGLSHFIRRTLDEAEENGAKMVILRVNTFGGRVDAAVQIRDALLTSPLPTVAFIDKRAISAGALISLACEKIVISRGGTIGAAQPVQAAPGGEMKPVEEKVVSYFRKEMKSTAEARGRPARIAEAMVDADVEIEGLVEKGKLLTLTTQEAVQHGVADYQAESVEELKELLGVAEYPTYEAVHTWAEDVVRFLTSPVVSSLLLTLGLLGLLVEFRVPGFGLPGIAGITFLTLFFLSQYIVNLAGWEEVLLFAAGLTLLALELFVIPGFGIAGVAGIALVLTSLVLALVSSHPTMPDISGAVTRVGVSFIITVAAFVIFLKYFSHLPFGRTLVLETSMSMRGASPAEVSGYESFLGKTGTALTTLRPAGSALVDGTKLNVVTEGDFIEKGERIRVIQVSGNRIVVRRA